MAGKVANIIKIFGLTNAAKTIVGDNLIRGVSGGEKKRVTLAEMMMGNARVLLLGACARAGSRVPNGQRDDRAPALVPTPSSHALRPVAGSQMTLARVWTAARPRTSWML